MRIELSAEQQHALLAWAAEITASEAASDCEPAGYTLEVAISAQGASARAFAGLRSIDLGEAAITLSEGT